MMVENGKTLCQCAWFSLSEVDQELIVSNRGVGTGWAERASLATLISFYFFFFFDKGRQWTVLLKEIFPIVYFSTVTLSFLRYLGCCKDRKLQRPWGLAQTLLGGFTEPSTVVRDFHFVKIINALYRICPSKV